MGEEEEKSEGEEGFRTRKRGEEPGIVRTRAREREREREGEG